MKTISRVAAALLAGALAAGCSGGASPGTGLTPSRAFTWSGKTGHFVVHISIPSKQKQAAVKALAAKHGINPNYLPLSAATITFSLVQINGGNTGSPNTPTPFDFTLNTSDVTHCTAGSGGYSCSATTTAPAAVDSWQIVARDSNGTPNKLSETNFTVTVPAQGSVSGNFTLNPIVASIAWVSSQPHNGPATPSWNGSAYTCPTAPTTYCYDPIVSGSTPASDVLTLNVMDADGNTIIPYQVGGSSAAPYKPIYLAANGAEDSIVVTCNSADIEWIKTGISVPINLATLHALAQNPNPDMANGFNGKAGIDTFQGAGNPSGGNKSFNSPLNGQDTATNHQATDFSGTPIADGFYGNNGANINYDGGGNLADGSLSWHCDAVEAGGHTVSFYLGYAEGSIGWGTNSKTRHTR